MKLNKIAIISLVLLAIITFGAVSAAEDVTADDSAVLDNVNLNADGDIAINDAVTDVNLDGDVGDDAIGDMDNSNIINDSKDLLSSSKLVMMHK